MSEEVIELTDEDIIDETYIFDPSEILTGDDWGNDLNIIFSETGESCFQKLTMLSDIDLGIQFSYRGEVCVKRNHHAECFYNVESSSGLMYLHPTTMVHLV